MPVLRAGDLVGVLDLAGKTGFSVEVAVTRTSFVLVDEATGLPLPDPETGRQRFTSPRAARRCLRQVPSLEERGLALAKAFSGCS